MSETSSERQSEFPPLDTRIKCLFQVKLMEQMGVRHGDHQAQIGWVAKYAKVASELIEKNPKIRALVENQETWPKAIQKVKKLLDSKE